MAAMYETDVKVNEPHVGGDDSSDDVIMEHIEPKYRGNESDKLDMKVLGRTQETRRMFTAISMLG